MIEIKIPNNYLPERIYIIDILFGEFLGLKYTYKVGEINEKSYVIVLENGNKITIRDFFFSNFSDGLEYLCEKNIPLEVNFTNNRFLIEEDIPIIFGNEEFEVTSKEILCGIDIFASSFFMLSGWEAYVSKDKDFHNRFPATASLAYKNKFLDRPIVNEYLELLWNMLCFLGCKQKRKGRDFQLYITHDVDVPFKWKDKNIAFVLKNFLSNIIRKKSLFIALQELYHAIFIKIGLVKDPFDTFDYLMDLSEKAGVKSHFYFMSGGVTFFDSFYLDNNYAKEIIKNICERGHNIGIHPSYNTYNNRKQWEEEYQSLLSISRKEIKTGRQHYLRFEVPTTWQIWEDNDMLCDSTLSFAEQEGFRCGTCYEYSTFNILTRKKLKLKEYPLIAMETSLVNYQNMECEEVKIRLSFLIKKVKRYKGNFVLLWHNSNLGNNSCKEYKNLYKNILDECTRKT